MRKMTTEQLIHTYRKLKTNPKEKEIAWVIKKELDLRGIKVNTKYTK